MSMNDTLSLYASFLSKLALSRAQKLNEASYIGSYLEFLFIDAFAYSAFRSGHVSGHTR
jgi:hypothetical protein